MNRLENKYNIELYEIVDFLDDFYDCQEANSCTQIQNEIFSCYQILINMTKSDGFRKYGSTELVLQKTKNKWQD